MHHPQLELRPLAGALGAEVFGVDLGQTLDADLIGAIRRAWLEHLVLFFRDQRLDADQYLAFARRIAEPVEYPMLRGLGPEPLSNAFNAIALGDALAGKRTPVKAALLDQKVV